MGLQNREGALYYATGLDTTGLTQGKAQTMGILRGMTSQISRMDVFAGLAASGGIAFKRLAVDAKKFSEEFEQSMREVLTISAALQGDFEGYSDMIVDMSRELPQSANALAKAYYQIVSAGYDGAAGLELLQSASRAAVGGVTDVTTAADGMTTVLNAWGLSADQSSKVADTFFATIRLGKTTMDEMASSISQVAAIASASGISFEEVAATLATMTKQGVPTAQAMTQMRAAIMSTTKVLGDGWADAMSMQEAFQLIAEKANYSQTELQKLLGREEAVNAVLITTGKNAKGAAEDLQAIANSAGEADKAYTDMVQSSINQSKLLKNNIDAALKPLGDWMSEKSTGFARRMNEAFATGQVEQYVEYIKIATVSLTAYALTANGAALSTNILKRAMDLTEASMRRLRLAFASNPVGLIAVGLTAAVTAFTAYNKKVDKSTQVSARLTESISNDVYSLNNLFSKLKDAERGTEDWNRARELINTRYGSYLGNLIDEKTKLEDIEAAQKRVTQAMVANAGVKIYQEQLGSELDKYTKEFEKKLGDFTQVFAQMKGADRLPDLISAINEAIDKEIEAGNGKIERGLLERSQIAMDVYNEFLYDISQQTGFVKYDPKSFTDAFLDLAELKAEGKDYTDYLQGMIDTWTKTLQGFHQSSGEDDFIGLLLFDYDSLFGGNYYETLQKKISETEDQLKDLAGAQGEMDLVAIAAKKELLQQYNAELMALELLLGLREKEKQEAAKQAPAGSILGLRQQIEELNQQYVEATTDAARESLKAQIDIKEQELDALQGVIKEQVKLYEDYYKTIQNKGINWLRAELESLKQIRDAKRKTFKEGGKLSEDEKKKIVDDLSEIESKIQSIESKITGDLKNGLRVMEEGFQMISSALSEVDDKASKAAANIGKLFSAAGQIGIGVATEDPFQTASGMISIMGLVTDQYYSASEAAKGFSDELKKINGHIKDQEYLIRNDATGDKAEQLRDLIKLYEQYAEALRRQIEYEQTASKWQKKSNWGKFLSVMSPLLLLLPDKDIVPELEEELKEIDRLLEKWGLELGDTIRGGVSQTDISGIIIDEFMAAKGGVVDFANATEQIIKDALMGAFKSAVMQEGVDLIAETLYWFLEDDGKIDEVERAGLQNLIAGYGEKWNTLWEDLGLSDLFGSFEEDSNSLSGSIRRSLTEETGSILAGTMNAIRMDTREILQFQSEAVGYLRAIERNTAFNRYIESIDRKMDSMLSTFQNIA